VLVTSLLLPCGLDTSPRALYRNSALCRLPGFSSSVFVFASVVVDRPPARGCFLLSFGYRWGIPRRMGRGRQSGSTCSYSGGRPHRTTHGRSNRPSFDVRTAAAPITHLWPFWLRLFSILCTSSPFYLFLRVSSRGSYVFRKCRRLTDTRAGGR
jgi:hypothetical protein